MRIAIVSPLVPALAWAALAGFLAYHLFARRTLARDAARARVDEYMKPPSLEELAGEEKPKERVPSWTFPIIALVAAFLLRLPPLLALAAAAGGYLLPKALKERSRRRRVDGIEKELPAALDTIASLARIRSDVAGILETTAETLAANGETPLARELRQTAARIGRVGAEQALRELEEHSPSTSLRTLAFTLRVFARSGGTLGDLVLGSARRLRDIIDGREAARARAASMRQTAIMLPLILILTSLLIFRDPDVRAFYGSPAGQLVALGCIGAMVVGWYVIESILEGIR